MALRMFSLEQKIETLDFVIDFFRGDVGRHAVATETIKSIVSDLRGRQALPRSQTLGELERALFWLQRSKTALGYDEGKMIAVANIIVNKWPTIRQALEQFGEEPPE